MVILITGASHTGKTVLAQKMLEAYKYPYLSIDHLKMGLIRSGNLKLTPTSGDKALTEYLWLIVCEMIKTVIENEQNLIVEGCYIPFDWERDFNSIYLENIKFYCLVMSEDYIKSYFTDIKQYANAIEKRLDDDSCTMERVLSDNAEVIRQAQRYDIECTFIDDNYEDALASCISKKSRSTPTELTNLCVLCDGDMVLVEDKIGAGIVFPGGHVEEGESFQEAVIREMQEETGLTVFNPVLMGIKDYFNKNGSRCIVTIYKTDSFTGTLKSSKEGKVFWVSRKEFDTLPDVWGMHDVLRICDSEELSEMFWDFERSEWLLQ